MARPATDIRQRILTAARSQFRLVGVEAASLRTIAREARTSVAMVSYYFGSKDGLFTALVDQIYDPFLEGLRAAAAAVSDPIEKLRAVLHRFAGVGPVEREMLLIILREATVRSPRLEYVGRKFLSGHFRLVAELLVEARAAGRVRAVSPISAVPGVLGPIILPIILQDTVRQIVGDLVAPITESAIDIVMNGLLPRESVEPPLSMTTEQPQPMKPAVSPDAKPSARRSRRKTARGEG